MAGVQPLVGLISVDLKPWGNGSHLCGRGSVPLIHISEEVFRNPINDSFHLKNALDHL